MRAVTAPRDVWGRVMLCPGAGGLRVHCPHREFHPKTKKSPKKNLYFEASPTQKWGVFEQPPPLLQAVSVGWAHSRASPV